LLDHQEFQSEDDPPDTSDNESAGESKQTNPSMPLTTTPIHPPQPPNTHPNTPKDWDKIYKVTKFGMEALGLVALIVYTIFSVLQWAQIRWTNRLTREALDGSNYSLKQTLAKMQRQIDEMHSLATNAGTQADRTKDLADRMKDQADRTKTIAEQSVIQAGAAQSAAQTAKDTLHTSERAYVVFGNPRWDYSKHSVEIPLINNGHIPSGVVEITSHSVIVEGIRPNPSQPVQWSWSRKTFATLIPGVPSEWRATFNKITPEEMNTGVRGFLTVGNIKYNDGFAGTSEQNWTFCIRSQFDALNKEATFTLCDYSEWIHLAESLDGYPAKMDQEQNK
jgi:hypothetical protein